MSRLTIDEKDFAESVATMMIDLIYSNVANIRKELRRYERAGLVVPDSASSRDRVAKYVSASVGKQVGYITEIDIIREMWGGSRR